VKNLPYVGVGQYFKKFIASFLVVETPINDIKTSDKSI